MRPRIPPINRERSQRGFRSHRRVSRSFQHLLRKRLQA
jgi:hypothetical protein